MPRNFRIPEDHPDTPNQTRSEYLLPYIIFIQLAISFSHYTVYQIPSPLNMGGITNPPTRFSTRASTSSTNQPSTSSAHSHKPRITLPRPTRSMSPIQEDCSSSIDDFQLVQRMKRNTQKTNPRGGDHHYSDCPNPGNPQCGNCPLNV